MAITEHGKVKDGAIVFDEPLDLPDGTEVNVKIEPVLTGVEMNSPLTEEEFASLPFFGMWANRVDMHDSVAWVNRERDKWNHRSEPRG